MLMKKILLLISFFLICTFQMQYIFASSWDIEKPKTLLEMQEEKHKLEEEETVLQFKWTTFQLWNDSLGDIMKIDLSAGEKNNLEEIINIFLESKEDLEKELDKSIERWREIEDIKTELLEWKHNFYKNLIPFIQIEKLESFKKYVDSDLNYNEKSKSIQDKIQQNDIQKTERLEELQDKIDDNSRDFRKKIEETITLRVWEKLDIFVSQENFSLLENEVKTEIFLKIILKFEDAINNLEDSVNPTAALEAKIIGLEVVIEILESYRDEWK